MISVRYKKVKKVLIFLCLFIGIGALYGGLNMLFDPTGKSLKMDELLPYFKTLPFSNILFKNYMFSGISLIVVNGITNLIAAYFLIKNKKIGIILGTIFGFTLMLWIIIQFIIFPMNILSITYFIFGVLQLISGYITYVFYMQEQFSFDANKYHNIGKNKESIVVYFSRMGYTKWIAYEKANRIGADILEIKTKEKTDGTLGFWWCGRYGMHKWNMKIEELPINLQDYQNVIIVSPIWVFSICAPIREFCYQNKNYINNAQYIFTHFMNCSFKNVADELDKIINKKRNKFTSICIRLGKVKSYRTFEK